MLDQKGKSPKKLTASRLGSNFSKMKMHQLSRAVHNERKLALTTKPRKSCGVSAKENFLKITVHQLAHDGAKPYLCS